MNPIPRLAAALASTLLATACGTFDVKRDVKTQAESRPAGPEATPTRTITNFSAALRCMDSFLITWGVRDLPILVEDLNDQTKKVNAGTKDMLISAVSDMTRRSNAIKLITYGRDTGNLIALIESVKGRNAFESIPPYGIRGSVSQLDDAVVRKSADGGIAIDPYLSIGAAKNASASVLGIDLTVVSARDLAVVPGVTSRNSVVIYRESNGADADATIRKFGVNFSMNLSRSEGQAQALRNLVELAAVELVGKLAMLPYWRCLGTGSTDETIQAEIEDWYQSLALKPAELVRYFQYQLKNRGYYRGAVDGQATPELDAAAAAYRVALGLAASSELDSAFFHAYLEADHAAVLKAAPAPLALVAPKAAEPQAAQAKIAAPKAVEPKVVEPKIVEARIVEARIVNARNAEPKLVAAAPIQPVTQTSAEPLRVVVASPGNIAAFRRNQPVPLMVATNREAHVYCYLRDENRNIQRIFPNRFTRDARVRPTHPAALPGDARVELRASPRGVTEAVVCYASTRDVFSELPARVVGRDFEPLAVSSLEEIKQALRATTHDDFAEGVFHVRVH